MNGGERKQLARKRLLAVLTRHGVANARTLEQKISDAGPVNQRIDPHILTPVRQALEREGIIGREERGGNTWYYLGNTPKTTIDDRLATQLSAFRALQSNNIGQRIGQALEIATYRALLAADVDEFFGRYTDLDVHDDSTLYRKEEPPQHIGRHQLAGKQRLDFLVRHPDAGHLGLECKNVREWLYPDREEIRETLRKCLQLNCVPVIIGRRIPFVTFKLMNACGVVVHQTYNQLMAVTDMVVANRVKHKDNLGYHDIRLGNVPDARLLKFITTNLPAVAKAAREKFEANKDLLTDFSSENIPYHEFAARVRRRAGGTNEDHDWEPPDDGFEE